MASMHLLHIVNLVIHTIMFLFHLIINMLLKEGVSMKYFSNFKYILCLILILVLTLSGCRTPEASQTSSVSVTEPEPDDVILSINDQEVPYRIFKHYYNAAAMNLASASDIQPEETQPEKLLTYTENLLLDDYVYLLLGAEQNIHLTDDELLAIQQNASERKSQQPLPDALDELLQFRLQAQTLKNKIFITMYQNDFKQSAVHVQSLFIPYANQSEAEISSKKQLALLLPQLLRDDQSLEEQAAALLNDQNAVFEERYLTNGDMGQGTYQLASELEVGQISQPFTLGTDGVYILQRLPSDENYIDQHIEELLENSAEFSSLYPLLVYATRQYAQITYTDKEGLLSFLQASSR